jgi:hypothetical protein
MLHRYFKVCKSRVSMTHPDFILEKSRIYICTYANHWICVFLQIPAPMWGHWGPLLKQKMYRYDKFTFMWILETLEAKIWQQYTTSWPLLSSPDQTFRLPWIQWEYNPWSSTYLYGVHRVQQSHWIIKFVHSEPESFEHVPVSAQVRVDCSFLLLLT